MNEDIMNAPAFGPQSEIAASETSVEQPVEQSIESEESSVEENRVPYSRFKNIHSRALEAERMAAQYEAELQALRTQQVYREPVREEASLPSYWVEMYGDSAASKRAWEIQQEQNNLIRQQAREEALSAVREEREMESTRISENLETIDERLDALSAFVGRDLSDREQSAILDIVDEYTPQDEDGNYLGEVIPFEKAWEIYELKNQVSASPRKQARNSIAGISGSQTQGETSIGGDKSNNFNPLDWDAWRKRV